jgi:hypothetical protein
VKISQVLIYKYIAYSPTVNQGIGTKKKNFFAVEGQGIYYDKVVSIY